MNFAKHQILLLTLFLTCLTTFGQVKFKAQNLIDEAVVLMKDSSYSQANEKFLEAVNIGGILPDDFCYHFGVNLYHTNYRPKSIAFLEKYIDLRGEEGQYYSSAIYYLNLLQPTETEIIKDTTGGDTTKLRLTYKNPADDVDPCEGHTEIICPICQGTGVVVKKNSFGDSYRSCEFSDPNGVMDCEHYKLYLKGTPKKY